MDRGRGLAAPIGADPSDSDEMRLRKALLVVLGLPISLLAVGWGLIYIIFGEPLGGAIPLTYTVLSLASVVLFTLTRRYDWFRFAQLGLMLVLPFVLMVVLGGFVLSSVVAAWAFVAPLGALAFASPREALRWFGAYLILVVLTGTLGGAVRTADNPPPGPGDAMVILHIAGGPIIRFTPPHRFVRG